MRCVTRFGSAGGVIALSVMTTSKGRRDTIPNQGIIPYRKRAVWDWSSDVCYSDLVGALGADPRVNGLLRPSDCVAAELDRLGKFPFGHPAIDRRPAQPDTVLDFLEADEARHAFRLCWRRHSTFSHDDLQRSPRRYPPAGHPCARVRRYDQRGAGPPGARFPWPNEASRRAPGCPKRARERRAIRR